MVPLHRVVRQVPGLGRIAAVASAEAVVALSFPEDGDQPAWDSCLVRRTVFSHQTLPLLEDLFSALAGFARGELRHFQVTMDISRLSVFTQRVLVCTAAIPWGETRTYGQIAACLGQPKAAQAVGQALGRNPLPVLIPCHRVLASHGLGGFGCGLVVKRRLLAIEQKIFTL